MANNNLFDNHDENELPEELLRYLQFELEYYKHTEWEVDEKQLEVYIHCCEAMELIAEYNNGYVVESFWVKPDNILKDIGPKDAVCKIKVPCFGLTMESFKLFQGVLSKSRCIDISPTNDEMIHISIEIPNVFIDKGIPIFENINNEEVE